MGKTELEKKIEERATKKLLLDLRDAYEKEQSLANLIGKEYYDTKLEVFNRYSSCGRKEEILLKNDFTEGVFERLLPSYVATVTDELLSKVDEIQWLLEHPDESFD